MKSLVLSMLSSRATWAEYDSASGKIISAHTWDRIEGSELSASLTTELERFFTESSLSFEAVRDLCVLAGPGSFTGLRVSSSFMQGLAVARALKLRGIPSFRLFGEPFAIPLRALKAAELGRERYTKERFKFLEIRGDREFKIVDDPKAQHLLGFAADVAWPRPEAIQRAMQNSRDIQNFEIHYGYEPEFKIGV